MAAQHFSPTSPLRPGPAAGFTLVEVVLTVVIVAVIMLGIQSAMLLAGRASPDRNGAAATILRAASAVDQLREDLAYATSVSVTGATSIEFVVADRNNDGSPETIRYSWSGVAGDPLLRSINARPAVAIASDVRVLQFVYDRRSQQLPTTCSESGEILLSSLDNVPLFYLGDFAIDSSNWVGQYFRPSLPAGAVKWRVTRVKLRARNHGSASGQARVQIRAPRPGGPFPGVVLEEMPLYENSLGGNYTWQEFLFSSATERPAGNGACLVIQWQRDAHACDVQYQALLASAPNADLVVTNNSGQSWSMPFGQDLCHYIYGTYSVADPAAYEHRLRSVQYTLRCGADASAVAQGTIRLLNEPSVPPP
ncbi:prepilin-type N-terminal cleavage/methylation domain-containing protein [Fontivita pretiosa]|uniref:prepilin-type N-terminal cleavage/methylation domain-containing protein n=1 Tax=Fontivita pretiosa TaxID=2989684 RepID=UPI003D183889